MVQDGVTPVQGRHAHPLNCPQRQTTCVSARRLGIVWRQATSNDVKVLGNDYSTKNQPRPRANSLTSRPSRATCCSSPLCNQYLHLYLNLYRCGWASPAHLALLCSRQSTPRPDGRPGSVYDPSWQSPHSSTGACGWTHDPLTSAPPSTNDTYLLN